MNLESPLVLATGSQVITLEDAKDIRTGRIYPKGSVGAIIRVPAKSGEPYRLLFPDGGEADSLRSELALRKHVQRGPLDQPESFYGTPDLREYVIYRCVVGSRAYGLNTPDSDVDLRGIYLPPAEIH